MTCLQASAQPLAPKWPRDEASFQLALTLKLRADEAFLLGDAKAATKLYGQAEGELKIVGSEWRDNNNELSSLLESDIAYRQTLLRLGADFWGAAYSLTPINPVEAYDRLEKTVAALEEIVKQIDDARRKATTAGSAVAVLAAYRDAAQTDGDVQALKQVIEEIKITNHTAKATAAQDRIDRNIARQKDIATERTKLSQQYAAVHKKLDSLVVNGAMQAAGLPPEIASLADGDKPLEQRLLAAGRAYVISDNAILETFKGFSQTTAKIVDAAQTASDAANRLNEIRQTGEAALAAVRRGTLDGALEAGLIVYNNLPEGDKARLAKIVVNDTKPLMALLDTAQRVKPTLDVIADVVSNDPGMRAKLEYVLKERISENTPDFDQWYRARLVDASKLPNSAGLLAEQAVRGWPSAFLAQLPDDIKADLRKKHGVADESSLARAVFAKWPSADLRIVAAGANIQVSMDAKSVQVDIRRFVETQAKVNFEVVGAYAERAASVGEDAARREVETQLSGMLASGMSAQGAFTAKLASSVHALDSATSLSRVLPASITSGVTPKDSAKLFDQIWAGLPAEAKGASEVQLASMQAGSVIAKDVLSAPRRVPPRASVDGDSSFSNAKANEALLKAAVAAAFPAAGVAFAVADAVTAMGEMNSLADQINDLTREDRAIMSEQFALYDLVRDERVAQALGEVNIRIAERRSTGALKQIEKYDLATLQLDTEAQRQRVAQRLFMPRAFLLSEQLRARFDQLDRSLAFWTGDPRAPRGQIARNILADPQWIRYALDPGIQVFKWLDRGSESDRGDLVTLSEEWKRKLQLASNACDVLQCKKDTAVVGEVTTSPEISLKTLLPDQWRAFEKWRTANDGSEFAFEFLLAPKTLQPQKQMHIIRFVSARAGVRQGTRITSPQGSALYHPGTAYVPYEASFVKEHYLPKPILNPRWDPFSTVDARARWRTKSLSLGPAEGYGLYTLWRFVLQDTAHNKAASDVVLQFGYQYQLKNRVFDDRALGLQQARDAAWRVNFKTADNQALAISVADLPFFGSEKEARDTINRLLSDPDAGRAGLLGMRLTEEKANP